ncbi:MAG: helix-turn-helix domain-containing protein [Segetibacter sp.]
MISKNILPSAPLSEYIQQYRLRHFVFANGNITEPKPFPPRPEQSLTFFIRGAETTRYSNTGIVIQKPRSVISGQFTYRVDRYVSFPEILMIIVDFKPGALYRLTSISFKEFTNKDVDAETVLTGIKNINDQLSSSETYAEMIEIVEQFFIKLILQSKKELLAIDLLFTLAAKEPDRSVDWLARNAYLSTRQLERKFDERIGISPKTFLRISRFNQSYWLRLKNPKLSWFQIAMSCGYTDYQHLVKEYKDFANNNPTNFFSEESKAPGRILGLTI